MNTSLVGRQLELTEAMKSHIQSAIESLKKYNLDIISTRVVVSPDDKKGFTVEFSINVAHKNTVVIKQTNKDMYAGVDIAIERAKKVLRRYHDKIISHRGSHEVDENRREVDEIIPMELELYKPLAIEDATEVLKDSKRSFLVYSDYDDNVKVLQKRRDSIVEVEISDTTPISIEDGLKKLKNDDNYIHIFIDEDHKTRVLSEIRNNLYQLY
jgi:putative sigma-54 modulation protein